jgi:pilus assembly protein CpaC
MLEVRVAEMERTLLRRLGVNLAAASGGQSFGVSALKNLVSVLPPTDPSAALVAGPVGLGVSQAVNALLRFQTGSTSWTGFIDALKEENLVKVLAEPTLVALSGQEAHFLAGGEFPIPVPQAFGVTTIQFKKFGIQLNFNPVVLSPTRISVTVAPEVSDLDFANGLSLQGFRGAGHHHQAGLHGRRVGRRPEFCRCGAASRYRAGNRVQISRPRRHPDSRRLIPQFVVPKK